MSREFRLRLAYRIVATGMLCGFCVMTIGISSYWFYHTSSIVLQIFSVLGMALGGACGVFAFLIHNVRLTIGDDGIVHRTCFGERRIAAGDIKRYKMVDASVVLYGSTNETPVLTIPCCFEGLPDIKAWVAARATNLDEVERLDPVLQAQKRKQAVFVICLLVLFLGEWLLGECMIMCARSSLVKLGIGTLAWAVLAGTGLLARRYFTPTAWPTMAVTGGLVTSGVIAGGAIFAAMWDFDTYEFAPLMLPAAALALPCALLFVTPWTCADKRTLLLIPLGALVLLPYCATLALHANALITRHVIFSREFQVVAKTEPRSPKQYTDLTRLMLRPVHGTNVFPTTFPTRWCAALASGNACFVSQKIGWLGITWFDLSTRSDATGDAGKR